jgi:hypothetical protein
MSSAYEERVKCLGKLNREGKGTLKKLSLEKQNKKAEEGIKVYEHFFKTRYINKGMDYRYVIEETTKQIDDIKKESEAKLKKDLAGKVALLEGAKEDLKKLEKTKKEFKKGITENKKLIASNTKKIKKIEKNQNKCYEKEKKGYTGKKRARCPNGTRKNKSSGRCEKK